MKISPILYTTNIFPKQVLENNTNSAVHPNVSIPIEKTQISNIYYQPVNFSSKLKRTYESDKPKLKERSGDFQICRFSDIPCPACGKKMLSRAKFEQFAEDLANVPPEKYLEFLGEYEQYMRPIEASVYKEICQESQKPGASTDIRELLVSLRDHKLPILQEAQMKLVNKMVSLAKSLPDDEQKALMGKINQLKGEIRRKNAAAPFRRKIMIDRISKVKIRNKKKYEKLQRIAKNFPTSSDMNSAWIVKYSGKNKYNEDWDSYSIATRFLQSSISNTDHILAYDIDNRHDDISNYMAMHNACNGQKGNKPFLQWLNEDRENRINYMQQYFDSVNELISTRRIGKKKYRNYVAYATQTVWEVSKGQVKITPTAKKEEDFLKEAINNVFEEELNS